MDVRAYRYDTVEDVMRHAKEDACLTEQNTNGRKEVEARRGDVSWYGLPGSNTAADIRRIISNGWTDGASRIAKLREQIEVPPLRSVRRRLVWTDQGDDLHMDRVYAGAIDSAWTRGKRRSTAAPKTIRIVVDGAANANVSAQTMVWRGIAALVVADALCEAGHNVEVGAAYSSQEMGVQIAAYVVTKPVTAPLDISSLAATTALTGFFRSVIFQLFYAKYPHDTWGLGQHVKITTDMLEEHFPDDSGETHVATADVSSKKAAQAWVNETLAAFAV